MTRVLDRAPTPELVAPATLSCAGALQVAAGTLARMPHDAVAATTVVGVLGLDDVAAFHAVLARIEEEFQLDARVRLSVGSFSVRFSHRPAQPDATPCEHSIASAHGLVGRTLHLLRRR